ncbi:u5 small nuclear ribonucleoprotein component [Anaeramoeba flamelloides]|uniref:116 kDa U5 small nuclear ribonucleoprotein component n=1 Tax=Anaeramoeba flamelloides TaxID=1746091 RepID=A0ABQ8Y8E8_9EUKA|nr:u5 small nuclear ribonucleoprotein component [Anaeramoeba flamelloides]
MDDLYDEFGNYIGPSLGDQDKSSSSESEDKYYEPVVTDINYENEKERTDNLPSSGSDDEYEKEKEKDIEIEMEQENENEGNTVEKIVLNEDKQYYQESTDIYGEGVEVLVEDEDEQDISVPIVQVFKEKQFHLYEKQPLETTYSLKFVSDMSKLKQRIRNICIAGHLHHGKTTFLDNLVQQTHPNFNQKKHEGFTDTRVDEHKRGVSIKSTPLSLILPDLRYRSYLFHMVDTPGGVVFGDEFTSVLRICDGIVLIVDAVEGVLMQTKQIIKEAISNCIPIVLVVNKIDRLILDLKLPPKDAYQKIRLTIEEVNTIINKHQTNTSYYEQPRLSPETGNVCFASSRDGWCFTVNSFAKKYLDKSEDNFDYLKFAKRLWGDIFFNPKTRKFVGKKNRTKKYPRSFVQFILEPIYKLYSQIIGESPKTLKKHLDQLEIKISKKVLHGNVRQLLRSILSQFFKNFNGFVDMCVQHLPSPSAQAKYKLDSIYVGSHKGVIGESLKICDPEGPLMVNVVKLIERKDCERFDCLARIFSGTLRAGQKVKIYSEKYIIGETEGISNKTVGRILLGVGRYCHELKEIGAGNIILIENIDKKIGKFATLTNYTNEENQENEEIEIENEKQSVFKKIQYHLKPVIKIGIEPLKPQELPRMIEGLSRILKSYPALQAKKEESGEHILLGTGELSLDCALYDLREMYSEIEIKVSDPCSNFCETVADVSDIQCYSESPNQKNKLYLVAEQLEKKISNDIENGVLKSSEWDEDEISEFLQNNYSWDILASNSVWSFSSDYNYPNMLLNQTLPIETDQDILNEIKDPVIQGFSWACSEGPLCEEPIRDVKFLLQRAELDENQAYRSNVQIIPTIRRVVHSSFLRATPKMMEPIWLVEIIGSSDALSAGLNVIRRRRGRIIKDYPKPGTPLSILHAYVPVMDSFSFEVDLRTSTQGLAFCQMSFDHWQVVTGNPLDTEIELTPLVISDGDSLARDYMIKTRRRKGLSEIINYAKYFTQEQILEFENLNNLL